MANIQILDTQTINKIAAGEVIERPASIVKELIENALDARATRVTIDLEDGGRRLIRVSDDGTGMPEKDLHLAIQNHATSKLRVIEDLMQLGSLGFRGEALSSIASVSRFSLISRQQQSDIAFKIETTDGHETPTQPVTAPVGTAVAVAELFHNTPARRQFLRSSSAEKRAVLEVVTSYALMHPQLRILVRENDREILDLRSAATLRDRVSELLGRPMEQNLADVFSESDSIRVEGLSSRPPYGNRNRAQQWVFVNGRPVKDRTVSYAIRHAYRHCMPPDRFPVVVLSLSLPAEYLDVNVHPSKQEIRFRDERALHSAVVAALRSATGPIHENDVERLPGPHRAASVFKPWREAPVGQGVRISQALYSTEPTTENSLTRETPAETTRGQVLDPAIKPGEASLRLSGITPAALVSEESLYWQLHNAYILIQIKGGLVFVDQHAAHERVLYDKAVRTLEDRTANVQHLLFPITLELSVAQYAAFESSRELLDRLGFQAEPFGGKSIIVEGIPSEMKNWDEGSVFLGILDDLAENHETKRLPLEEKVLATFACRAAIMQGQKLEVVEMRALMDQLFVTSHPYTCPHGRPTLMRVGLDDLDYKFDRTPKT